MKKILIALPFLFISTGFAAENFNATVSKFSARGYKIVEVKKGETRVKKIFTHQCKERFGNASVSLDDNDKGYIRLSGTTCHVLGVERLAKGEELPPKPKSKQERPEHKAEYQSGTGVPIKIYNNIN